MTQNEYFRRRGLDKAAFLILLMLGLLAAQLLISFKTDFKLSEPIRLKGTGLEISIPAGDNWKRISNDFKYENNEFRLACLLHISGDSAITLQWRYSLLPTKKTALERFQKEAETIDGNIVSSDSARFGDFSYDYAKIHSDKITIFCGTTALPDGRILTLEVGHKGLGIELAEKIFKAMLASAKYKEDNPLAKGAEFLKNFKKSYTDFLPPDSSQNYYRIKDIRGNNIGFTAGYARWPANPNKNSLFSSAAMIFFNTRANSYAEMSFFHSDIALTKFDWSVTQSCLLTNREIPVRIQLDDSVVAVHRQDVSVKFALTDTMLPETFFDTAVAAFLRGNSDTIMLDFIISDGKITPAIISRINTPPASVLPAKSAAAIEIFTTNTTYQKAYFDGEGRLLLAEVQGGFAYKIERAAKADIITDFPQWAEKIRLLEQYKPVKAPGQKTEADGQ